MATLAELRTQAKQRADMVNSDFVTTPEWNTYLSSAYMELYDLLVGAYGNDYYATFGNTQTTDGTTTRYALPADFYKLLGVDQMIAGRWSNVQPFSVTDRNRTSAYAGQPAPAGVQYRLIYIPRPAALALDADTVDGVAGWEDYVVVRAAAKALAKEESDVSVLASELQLLTKRIEAMAENRDAGNPPCGTDAMAANGMGPGLGWGEYGDDFAGWPTIKYRLSGNYIWLVSGAF